ncbi:MAG: hypothetical protein ACXAC6_17665 [Candidatus Hodarchaeales archaeon]|jgi:hypothetical protein
MEPLDYILIFLGGYFLIAIIMWFVNIYLNIRIFRGNYEFIETNDKFSVDLIQETIQKQHEIGELDIKIYSSSQPQMIFLREDTIRNQVFEKSTLLISTRLFSEPFAQTDRNGIFGFLIPQILRIKHLKKIQKRKMPVFLALLFLIGIDILFLILAIVLLSPIFDIQLPVILWLAGNFFLIFRSGREELKRIYEADNYAFHLTREYPETLQRLSAILSKERSLFHKSLVILLAVTWVKPYPAISRRLQLLTPLKEERACPQCSKMIPISQSWCLYCQFNIKVSFSYEKFLSWISFASIGFIVVPLLIPGVVEGNYEDQVIVFLLYSFLCIFLMALVTERIHFQEILPRKPNSVILTVLLGIVLFIETLILFIIIESINPINKVGLQYLFVNILTWYIMGGFLLYYIVIEIRFKQSSIQWNIPRCPRCSQVISVQSSSCPNCRQQLRPTFQAKTETEEINTTTVENDVIFKFCPICGKKKIEKGKFCITCGNEFLEKAKKE